MAEILGTDISFPLVGKLATLKHHATHTIKWHSHDELEIHYVFTGALTYEFEHGRSAYTIPGGSLFIIPAHTRHRAANDEGAPSVRLGIQFHSPSKATVLGSVFDLQDLKSLFTSIKRHALKPFRFRARTGSTARDIYKTVENGMDSTHSPEERAHLRARLCALLLETFDDLTATQPMISSDNVAPTIMAYIREHCSEQISTEDLIRISGYGRTRLFELFTDIAGTTPTDYLNRCRVEKARELLLSSNKSIKDIAKECGFTSSSYFKIVFKKYFGSSPLNVRQHEGQAD